jgi:hypothetical protein
MIYGGFSPIIAGVRRPGGGATQTVSASQDESEVEKAFATMAERHVRGLLTGVHVFLSR